MVPRGCVGKGHALSILDMVKFRCMGSNATLEMAFHFRTDMVKISIHGPKRDIGNGVPIRYGHGKMFDV